MADEIVDATTPDTDTSSPVTPPTVPPASPQATVPVATGEDARVRGLMADLQRERRSRQDFERRFTETNTAYEAERRRVQALAGVNPRSAQDTELDSIRTRFAEVRPELADFTAEDLKALRDMTAQAAELREATAHHYKRHGRQMLDSVNSAAASELGSALSPRQTARLERAYAAEAEANPEFLARHDAGDPALAKEFVKEWLEDFYEPARRKLTADEVARQRRVPSGRDRSAITTGGKKVDFSNPKAVEDAMVASFRSHGGGFDRD